MGSPSWQRTSSAARVVSMGVKLVFWGIQAQPSLTCAPN